jgi:hypothetical protein
VRKSVDKLIRQLHQVAVWGFLCLLTTTTLAHSRVLDPSYDATLSIPHVVLGGGITPDTHAGSQSDPLSLHKYLYCQANPVNGMDPSGHENLTSMQIATTIAVTINLYSACQNIRAKRYAWAAVDILSAGLGGSGFIGPGAFKQLAFAGSAANAAATTAAAARGAMQVSQAWAAIEFFMMANSITPTGGGESGIGSSGNSSSPSGSGKISLEPNDAAIGLVKDGQIVKWIKYSDYSDPFTLPSHESLATLLNLLKQRGVLQEGVEAFTVGKGANGALQIRGSGNFNDEVSPATRALLEQTFQ